VFFRFLTFGAWSLILDMGIFNGIGGSLGIVVGMFFLAITGLIAPLYAGIAWGWWLPAGVTYGGAVLAMITSAIAGDDFD